MRKILIIFVMMFISAYAGASIRIDNVEIVGPTTSISGDGFGLGPTVSLYDNFNDGSHGDDINLPATIGSWTDTNGYEPYYDDVTSWSTSQGRGLSMQGGDIDCGGYTTNCELTRQLRYTHGSMVTEFYVSFLVMIPNGTYFPYALSTETFSDISSWKMNWFSVGNSSVANDMIIPSWIGSKFIAGGNAGVIDPDIVPTYDNYIDLGNENSFWAWGDWVRFTLYVKGNASDPYGYAGTVKVTAESPVGKFEFSDDTTKCFLEEYGYGITQWRFNGWMHTQGTVEQQHMVKPVYDDIYIATGSRALSRVEIGDAPVYANCTNREIQPALTWSDTGITGTLNIGSFAPSATVYFFVIDADGVPSAGKEVTLGGTPVYDSPIVTILTESQSTTEATITIIGTLVTDVALTGTGVTVNDVDATSSDGFETWAAVVPLSLGANTITAIGVDSETQEATDVKTDWITRTAPPSGGFTYTGSMSGGSYR